MDAAVLFLLLTNFCICKMDAEYANFYSKNGWIPISNERVFNDLSSNYLTIPSRFSVSNAHEQTSNNALVESIIKVVDPPELTKEFMKSIIYEPLAADETEQSAGYHNNYSINEDGLEKLFKNKKGSNKNEFTNNLRGSRKMNAPQEHFVKLNNETQLAEDKYNTYEVVEETDPQDILESDQNIIYINNNNKQLYEDEEITSNNFTSNLINILSNYNIRADDNLQNYALSLREKSPILNKRGHIYMRVPPWIALKYNSANHLPVDPLLAVFLSNYGYYVPGLYGFKQNYPNLYGYLASNNIHNNRPFGAYKLFSDTDSYL